VPAFLELCAPRGNSAKIAPVRRNGALPQALEGWLAAVRDAERRGELLSAFDLADRGLAEYPDDIWLKHRAVLALARAGATEHAAQRFDEYGLAAGETDHEDIAALRARIAKDVALAARGGVERRDQAARAAAAYLAVFERTGGYYPAINAATMSQLAGKPDQAARLARRVLELLRAGGDTSYYAAATEAEAQLLLGESAAARGALARAATLHGGDFGAVSTTRRQLRLVCELRGIDPEVLAALRGPAVVHFCGHRIAAAGEDGRFQAADEGAVAERIRTEIERRPATYGYGALASGGDIMWAEALLVSGAELHVVLPFARNEFLQTSVAPASGEWVARFERCIEAATAVSYATQDAYLDDDVLYRYGSELAMGLALLRARYLEAEVRQLALWDGGPPLGAASTAIDVGTWRRRGLPTAVVTPAGELLLDTPGLPNPPPAAGSTSGRIICAMLFADVKGFSKLSDEQLPRFAEHVLGAFAAVLERHADHVLHRNTWGDALYVVFGDVGRAAECGLELQEAMGEIDLVGARLPEDLALRLGAHVGPVFPITDPVLGIPAYMGSHVSRTARIEPVTPPAAVYVTEPFAAALVLAGNVRLACDYVGHMPAAKDYGRLRMYRLRRT
jgi:class 3 adenylate cyclase